MFSGNAGKDLTSTVKLLAASAFATLAGLTAFLADTDAYAKVINPNQCELPMSQGLRRAAECLDQCVAARTRADRLIEQKTCAYSIF